MGAWGTAIFSEDTARDVRNDFRDLIGDGLSPQEATDRMFVLYASSSDDPSFWLGLAVTQWKCGRLQDSVRARALGIIDSGADLQRWSHDAKLAQARQAVLDKTRAQLLSPQPAPKRIPKRFTESNDWEVGELISYRMVSGTHLVFRVVAHSVGKSGRLPIMDLLDYYDDTVPTLEQARRLPARLLIDKEKLVYVPYRRFTMWATSERHIPKRRLVRLGASGQEAGKDRTVVLGVEWRSLDATLERRIARSIRWQPGPGGDDYQQWELGDVLAYKTESGGGVLFHMVGRHRGHGVDGAPIVVQLDGEETSLPSTEAIGSGALVPHRYFSRDILAGLGIDVDTADAPCAGFVLVHDHDDAVDASSLRRIGTFGLDYHPDIHRFPFASVPMVVRRIERDRMRAGKAEQGHAADAQ